LSLAVIIRKAVSGRSARSGRILRDRARSQPKTAGRAIDEARATAERSGDKAREIGMRGARAEIGERELQR
jgi:hypothetical protein